LAAAASGVAIIAPWWTVVTGWIGLALGLGLVASSSCP